jgi:hypothetical protein
VASRRSYGVQAWRTFKFWSTGWLAGAGAAAARASKTGGGHLGATIQALGRIYLFLVQ